MGNIKSLLFIILAIIAFSCADQKMNAPTFDPIQTNVGETGTKMEIQFYKGKSHNHPTFSFWVEDMDGNMIETLYVTKFLGSGIYGHGSLGEGKWDNKPGAAKRPATLPYWLHKRGIIADGKTYLPTVDKPVPDAITGATPQSNFILTTTSTKTLPGKFRLLMEINQPWDWNEYWNNGKYYGDLNYGSSCQPALVYAVTIDQSKPAQEYFLNPIGHSHYSGQDGELYSDLSTFSTAKDIVNKVIVRLKK